MEKPKTHKLRILVIENNPLLDDGTRASDFLNMTDKVRPAVLELMDDIEYSSHGLVKCEIASWEKNDAFAPHQCEFTLKNGTKSNALDTETFKALFEKGWYGFWNNEWFTKEVLPPENGHSFSYDYDAMIKKYNVLQRRNRGEFNMILLANIDPVYCYESIMIGRNPYWINGQQSEYDCPLTAVMNVSVSRRDANFECFGHMMEMIMSHVFCDDAGESGYDPGEYNGIPVEKMNLWNRFILCARNYDGVTGCGNVHFSPNGDFDYDWANETYVKSTWRDWCDNYPNLTGAWEMTNCRAYLPLGFQEQDACRLHHRWWFYAMPHAAGVTPDGHSNSWWDYFCELDYVQEIVAPAPVTLTPGDAVSAVFELVYRSGKRVKVRAGVNTGSETDGTVEVAVSVTGNLSVCGDCGMIRACGHGTGSVTIWRDGCSATASVTIAK